MLLLDISCYLLLLFVASGVAAPQSGRYLVTAPGNHKGYESSKKSDKTFCEFSTKFSSDMKESPLPLLLVPGSASVPDFMYPNQGVYDIHLKSTEKIKIACPGKNNFITGIPPALGVAQISEMELECEGNNKFLSSSVQPTSFPIDNIMCDTEPGHVEIATSTVCDGGNGKFVEIGFELSKGFLKTIDVCWEAATMTTHWTRFILSNKIDASQTKKNPVYFDRGIYYGSWEMDKAYGIVDETNAMVDLVGPTLAPNYISKPSLVLNRGHLVAKGDFVYGPAQMTTYRYLNVAPQWKNFNSGNWATLEEDVRKFAATRTAPLTVYTGSHGQMTVEHGATNNPDLPVYLVFNKIKYNPVPKYFWKVIYDPVKKQGTAFVGVNDPWSTPADAKVDQYCKVIPGNSIQWLRLKEAANAVKGLIYVCEINNDLRRLIPTIPLFDLSNGFLA